MKNVELLIVTLALTVVPLFHAPAQSWLTNGLVGYYPFNGNANDESGNGRNAVVMGSGTQLTNGVNGAPNSAYRCVAPGGNYIEGPGVPIANSSLSVSLWFQKGYTNYTLPGGVILRVGSVGPSGGATGKQLQIAQDYNGAALRFTFFFDDFDIAAPSVGNGHWSHIACTFDKVTMERRIYIDGSLIATNHAVRGFSGPTDYFDFVPAGAADGLIDQVRFYNRVLSANEVAQLFEIESGPYVDLVKAVKPAFSGLQVGTNYQLQLSGDLTTWTNHGSPFPATNTSQVYPQYWDVDNWGKLFFRLQIAP